MKISLIVAVYNVEKYLPGCVDSLLNQTYKNIEIILVDDGSKDRSPLLCDEYAQKYPFVKVYHKENGGQSSARNLGILKSTGDYLTFVDADDAVHPMFCEIMADVVKETGCKIVSCRRKTLKPEEYEKEKKGLTFSKKTLPYKVLDTKDIIFDEFVKGKKHRYLNAFHTKLVKRDLFLKYKFNENLRDEEDTYLACQLFFECDRIGFADEILYFHIINKNSITHDKNNDIKNFKYLIESRKLIIEEFARRNYSYLNHVVSNIFLKVIYEFMVLFKKGNALEKEREKLLDFFGFYENILRPFELKIYNAFKEEKYLKVRFLANKDVLNIHMKLAGRVK